MGLTYLTVKLANPKNLKKSFQRRFLVDSGAVYSIAPDEKLKKLGIKPITTRKFVLANGQEMEKKMGQASFIFKNGESWIAPVIFGEKGIYLLGATTLENMGFVLDPINRKLEPLPMVL